VHKRAASLFHRGLCSTAGPHTVDIASALLYCRSAAGQHSLFPCPYQPTIHQSHYISSELFTAHPHALAADDSLSVVRPALAADDSLSVVRPALVADDSLSVVRPALAADDSLTVVRPALAADDSLSVVHPVVISQSPSQVMQTTSMLSNCDPTCDAQVDKATVHSPESTDVG